MQSGGCDVETTGFAEKNKKSKSDFNDSKAIKVMLLIERHITTNLKHSLKGDGAFHWGMTI